MKKQKNMIWILLIGLVILAVYFVATPREQKTTAAGVTTAVLTRTMPTSVKTSSSFVMTYTSSGATIGKYGVIYNDTATGGCTAGGQTTTYGSWIYEDVYEKRTTDTKTWLSPSTPGTCTFTGYVNFVGAATAPAGYSPQSTTTPSTDHYYRLMPVTSTITVCQDQCTSTTEVGCTGTTTPWKCAQSGVCLVKQAQTACVSPKTCINGACACSNQPCSTVGEKGCQDAATLWTCATSATTGCLIKQTSACPSGYTCSTNQCTQDCNGLEQAARQAISTYTGAPTAANELATRNAISKWAVTC